MKNKSLKEENITGERKRLSELKNNSYFVFTTRKKCHVFIMVLLGGKKILSIYGQS